MRGDPDRTPENVRVGGLPRLPRTTVAAAAVPGSPLSASTVGVDETREGARHDGDGNQEADAQQSYSGDRPS